MLRFASVGRFPNFSCMVRFYASFSDGTSAVDRGLGKVLATVQSHSGPLSQLGLTTWDLAEVNIDGPSCEAEVFRQSPDGALCFSHRILEGALNCGSTCMGGGSASIRKGAATQPSQASFGKARLRRFVEGRDKLCTICWTIQAPLETA